MSESDRFDHRGAATAILCRMPLDGSTPRALGVSGSPVDQFSFLESADDYINVLVRSDAWGVARWSAEWVAVNAMLKRVTIADFGDTSRMSPARRYRTR